MSWDKNPGFSFPSSLFFSSVYLVFISLMAWSYGRYIHELLGTYTNFFDWGSTTLCFFNSTKWIQMANLGCSWDGDGFFKPIPNCNHHFVRKEFVIGRSGRFASLHHELSLQGPGNDATKGSRLCVAWCAAFLWVQLERELHLVLGTSVLTNRASGSQASPIFSGSCHLEVSWNRDTPKSSMFYWMFPYKPSILGYPPFMETPIYKWFTTSGPKHFAGWTKALNAALMLGWMWYPPPVGRLGCDALN